jgi:hypothetical protein
MIEDRIAGVIASDFEGSLASRLRSVLVWGMNQS